MRITDLETLRQRVQAAIREAGFDRWIVGLEIEAGEDESGDAFLRVVLKPTSQLEDADWDRVEPLYRAIEDNVGQVDDRFASVRLDEAA